MPNLTDAELGRALRQNELSPVYFLYGREVFLSEGYLRKIQEKAVRKGTESFNLQRFDGGELDMVSLQVAEEGMPMMAERKCVTLMNPNLEKMRKEDFDALLEIVKDPNPACVFIIYVAAFELNAKKMPRVRKLIEAVAGIGTVVEFSPRTQGDLVKFLKTRFQKAGLTIEGPVASAMIARCGSTLEILSGEADKLIAYKGEGTVTREDVELVTRKSLEASVFDLSKLMLQNQYSRAFAVLEDLFQLREEPLAILGALSAAFLDLYRAKTAMLSSRTAEDVLALVSQLPGEGIPDAQCVPGRFKIFGGDPPPVPGSALRYRGKAQILAVRRQGSRGAGRGGDPQPVRIRRREAARMIKCRMPVVVEGKYDRITLSSLVDGTIVETGGFGIYRNPALLEMLRAMAKKTGIIVLTDSDAAGFRIRNHIRSAIREGKIINVYIPDVYGKERRKAAPSREGKLGVEGLDPATLEEAFRRAESASSRRSSPASR